tara:strand:+ start:1197 stop:1439 length:243 start_codon:yes stop_codon:yes gene_type:complete
MNTVTINKLAVVFILICIPIFIIQMIYVPNITEIYTNLVLDTEWKETRNKPLTTSDPFNICSPESFGDCKKVKMPHLSRA